MTSNPHNFDRNRIRDLIRAGGQKEVRLHDEKSEEWKPGSMPPGWPILPNQL